MPPPLLRSSLFLLLAILSVVSTRPFTPLDLATFARQGNVSPSPNGNLVVYSKFKYDATNDKSTKNLYVFDLTTDEFRPVTDPSHDAKQGNALFLSNKHIAYLNTTQDSTHVWALDVSDPDNEPYQLTSFPVSIANIKYSRFTKLLAFSATVYKNGTLEEAAERDSKEKKRKDTALVYDKLMIRHWDAFVVEKKNNIFVVQLGIDNDKFVVAGEPRNLLVGSGLESPVLPFGSAADFDFSPDGQELAFVAKAPGRNYAWETSQYIYLVPTAGDSPPVAINSDIPGASSYPRYKPDGNSIAYLQMFVRQYEADRNRLVTYNRATQRRKVVTADWDCSPSSIAWAVGEDAVFVTAQDKGHVKIFAIDTLTGELLNTLTNIHTASGIQILSPTALIFSMSSLTSPNNIYTISSAASLHTTKSATLTRRTDIHVNHEDPIDFPEPDEFWFVGAQNHPIHGWIITPPNFNSSKKYPLAFLIHGGPQGAWDDAWSVRWNPSVFAGAGFVVVAINPHGSTGYGQNFTDSIKGNWGTLPYDDLDRGLSHVLDKYPFVDEEKVAGLGASYGGFMVNWINGHSDRFRCLVNHDGVFSTLNTWYTGDELYFPEHEFGGVPYDPVTRIIYERFSPVNYVRKWRTPTLVIHGGRDYRLVDGEGFSTFTALQRQGIPSRLVYFPDENHWVIKPGNSLRWHKEVLGWITEWTAKEERFVKEEVRVAKEEVDVEALVDEVRKWIVDGTGIGGKEEKKEKEKEKEEKKKEEKEKMRFRMQVPGWQ